MPDCARRDARPSKDGAIRGSLVNFQAERSKELMLGQFHKPVKIRKMNDPREIGLEEFDTVRRHVVMRHTAKLADLFDRGNKSFIL